MEYTTDLQLRDASSSLFTDTSLSWLLCVPRKVQRQHESARLDVHGFVCTHVCLCTRQVCVWRCVCALSQLKLVKRIRPHYNSVVKGSGAHCEPNKATCHPNTHTYNTHSRVYITSEDVTIDMQSNSGDLLTLTLNLQSSSLNVMIYIEGTCILSHTNTHTQSL